MGNAMTLTMLHFWQSARSRSGLAELLNARNCALAQRDHCDL